MSEFSKWDGDTNLGAKKLNVNYVFLWNDLSNSNHGGFKKDLYFSPTKRKNIFTVCLTNLKNWLNISAR